MNNEKVIVELLKEIRDCLKSSVVVKDVEENDRFIRKSDGTVIDKTTNLMWGPTLDKDMTFSEAEKACKALTLSGHSDWRLPTVKELISLVDYEKCNPAIDTKFFPDTKTAYYWTSISYADVSGYAWVVGFYNGNVYHYRKGNSNCVRPVRSMQ